MTDTKSMGQIGYEAQLSRLCDLRADNVERFKGWRDWQHDVKESWEASALAVSIATLERLLAAGVSAEDALRGLKDGKTVEEVCAEWTAVRERRVSCSGNPCVCDWEAPHGVDGAPAHCPSCGWKGRCALPLESMPPKGTCPQCGKTAVGDAGEYREAPGVVLVIEGEPPKPTPYDVTDDGEEVPCSGSPEALAAVGKTHPRFR